MWPKIRFRALRSAPARRSTRSSCSRRLTSTSPAWKPDNGLASARIVATGSRDDLPLPVFLTPLQRKRALVRLDGRIRAGTVRKDEAAAGGSFLALDRGLRADELQLHVAPLPERASHHLFQLRTRSAVPR